MYFVANFSRRDVLYRNDYLIVVLSIFFEFRNQLRAILPYCIRSGTHYNVQTGNLWFFLKLDRCVDRRFLLNACPRKSRHNQQIQFFFFLLYQRGRNLIKGSINVYTRVHVMNLNEKLMYTLCVPSGRKYQNNNN